MNKTGAIAARASALALLLAALSGARASAAEIDDVKGSSQGILTDRPFWSGGAQLGNEYGTGLDLQVVGLKGAAANLALGIGKKSLAATGDYVWMTDGRFRRHRLATSSGYGTLRGQISPYVGGGVTVGPGVALRAPFGIQYTMTRDPFNFFAHAAPQVGKFGDADKFGFAVAFAIGARVLL